MKTILDEGVPERLRPFLSGHDISTVKRQGWNGIKNGQLLDLIEKAGFEAFITNDKRMEYEQVLSHRPFGSLLLSTCHWPTLRLSALALRPALEGLKPGDVIRVDVGKFVPKRFRKPAR